MFEYKFVKSAVKYNKTDIIAKDSYESIVEQHAAEGWRLAQIFVESPPTAPTEYVIIFEREKSD